MSSSDAQQLSFTVDTHLLRELGALLVGRDSTALLELIKNSYDADATVVTVHAEALDTADGYLVVADDGNGMTFERFESAFLRIAGRDKEGDRLSPRFKRRYTGAKGIGRLAAHKLAGSLQVVSHPAPDLRRSRIVPPVQNETAGVEAELDWDAMENEHTSLDDLGTALVARPLPVTTGSTSGTTMRLTRIREPWGSHRLGAFLEEIRNCRPATALTSGLPSSVLKKSLLFESPRIRESGPQDTGFELDLTGQLETGDELWAAMTARADWVVEIDSSANGIRYGVSPTERRKNKVPPAADRRWARSFVFNGPHPNPSEGPFFQSRILVYENSVAQGRSALAKFVRESSGIRVFVEGFRVLPFGSSGDDWLELDRDYVRKRREYEINVDDHELPQVAQEGFLQLGNRAYYGAVLLTEKGAPKLQALVNREGFVPDSYFQDLKAIVRAAPDLVVRARAALNRRVDAAVKADEKRAEEEANRQLDAELDAEIDEEGRDRTPYAPDTDGSEAPVGSGAPEQDDLDPRLATIDSQQDGSSDIGVVDIDQGESAGARSLRTLLATATDAAAVLRTEPLSPAGKRSSIALTKTLQGLAERMMSMREDQLTLQTLAGVGTQYAAFIHEVNGLLGQSQALRQLLTNFSQMGISINNEQKRALKVIRDSVEDLVQALTRQISYLTDVVGPDARRRRTRLILVDRVDSALRLLTSRIRERQQHVDNLISKSLRTPPIFPAEVSIILTNLLSNAVKFAGEGGRIAVSGRIDKGGRLHLRVDNTGQRVEPKDWERFFRPFESSTTAIDVVLGQGMGLGLPIVRSVLSDYEGTASFVAPMKDYSTAIEVVLPDPRPEIGLRNAS